MDILSIVFQITVLMLSVIIHEIAHGYAALWLGDPTAKYADRLSLNPLKHIDPFGSIIFPLLGYIFGGFIFGWAKPVPVNTYNLRNAVWGPALVALAGPASNILIACILGAVLRLGIVSVPIGGILILIIAINISLAVFNLIPIPPLDGSRLLSAVLPYDLQQSYARIEPYGFFILVLGVNFLGRIISPIILFLIQLIVQ